MNWDKFFRENRDLERELSDFPRNQKVTKIGFKFKEKSKREVRERKLLERRQKVMINFKFS